MLRQMFLVMLMLVAITACSGNEPVTDVPFATATPRTIETVAAPDSIGGAAIPEDFTGGEPIILGNLGTFDFSVSGEYITQVDTGTILYNYLPNSGSLPPRNQLYISASDATASQQVSFEFSPEIQIGQYNLLAPEDYISGAISAAYARLVFDGDSTRVQAFTENIEGTLTLTAVGEVLSGQFQFSADFTEESSEGEIDVQSVEVTGSFENVPYQFTLDDPFELNVPLPTRDFTDDATAEP